jgi:hypothetical protein
MGERCAIRIAHATHTAEKWFLLQEACGECLWNSAGERLADRSARSKRLERRHGSVTEEKDDVFHIFSA